MVALPLLVLAGMTLWWAWLGRDPRPGSIVPAWRPPDGVPPGAAGTLVDQRADPADVLATILDLAARGYLEIREVHPSGVPAEGNAAAAIARSLLEHTGLWSTEWEFRRTGESAVGLAPFERAVYYALFAIEPRVTMSGISDTFRARLPALYDELYDDLVTRGWFRHSPRRTRLEWQYLAAGVAGVGALLLVGGRSTDLGIALLVSGGIVLAFASIMPVVTREGARVRDQLLGVREYIRRAEREEVEARHRDRGAPASFEAILPYAIALGVVDLWLDEFGDLAGPPSWYVIEGAADPTAFSVHLGVFCAAAVSALGAGGR